MITSHDPTQSNPIHGGSNPCPTLSRVTYLCAAKKEDT